MPWFAGDFSKKIYLFDIFPDLYRFPDLQTVDGVTFQWDFLDVTVIHLKAQHCILSELLEYIFVLSLQKQGCGGFVKQIPSISLDRESLAKGGVECHALMCGLVRIYPCQKCVV